MICRSIDSGQRLLITQTAVCRKRRPALLAACARPADKVVSARKLSVRQPKEFTKQFTATYLHCCRLGPLGIIFLLFLCGPILRF